MTEDTKDLRIRTWTCPACGTVHDRDVNAAINIRNMGLSMLSAMK
ncbi:MAG: transposase [Oscillospiraceae bacterium]|nr:transposase [Oscillospiraceae bacterium]